MILKGSPFFAGSQFSFRLLLKSHACLENMAKYLVKSSESFQCAHHRLLHGFDARVGESIFNSLFVNPFSDFRVSLSAFSLFECYPFDYIVITFKMIHSYLSLIHI